MTAPFFPHQRYPAIGSFLDDYAAYWQQGMASLDRRQLQQAADLLLTTIHSRKTIFAAGNGGSAAIANHLLCDFHKGIQTGTEMLPRVTSLISQMELVTAIANDISYADIFSFQLRTLAAAGDVLLVISSSGNSENIIRALQQAKSQGLQTIALTGFDGGKARVLADISLHINVGNYGVVEDCHHSLMHLMAQYLRQAGLPDSALGTVKF